MEINLEEIEKQESSPFVERFEDFFNSEYKKEIEKIVEAYPDRKSLIIDFKVLEKFDPVLADELLDNPDSVADSATIAIQEINIPSLNVDEFKPHIRFSNLPKDRIPNIKDIGSEHLGKLICVEGLVRQITDVLPKLQTAVWKCKRCGNIYKIIQDKQKINMPNMCECHSRDFDLVEEKSDFIDYQKIQIQEPLEKLKGSEQAVYIDAYVSDDLVNKVSAGDKTAFVGILRLIPPQKDKKTIYGRFIDVNYLEETQKEFDEVDISKEEAEEIKLLSKEEGIFEKLTASIAPAIYGHEIVKESIVLQLFGGVTKNLPNDQKIRGNIHVLLIGDPGCLIGDERVIMGNGAIKKIENLGKKHLEKIDLQVLTGEGAKKRSKATTFFSYKKKKIMEIITESGKSIKGTYDHPLLCLKKVDGEIKRVWRRLDKFKINDKVAVVNYIPCTITKLIETDFKLKPRKLGPKFKGKLPKKITPELAGLIGYMLGDGWIRKKEAYVVVSEDEKDLVPKLINICKKNFGINPSLTIKIDKGRKIPLHRIGIHSTDIAQNLIFLRKKRVPEKILESGNKVVAEFLKWLFEADGCVFSKGRGNRSVSLKAKNIELLRDIQILLLRFSIHSRIVGNNLMIRRGNEIKKFGQKIGFVSKKKKEKMNIAIKEAEKHARFKQQRSEKIVKIIEHGLENVYDIEVPEKHRFIANGIISHNCGKSQLLQATTNIAPKSIYISGKTTSGVGLCVAPETIIQNDSGFKTIKEFVENNFVGKGKEEIHNCYSNNFSKESFTLGDDLKLKKGEISKIWRIKAPKKMFKIKSNFGKELSLTPNTALIRIKNGEINWIKSSELEEGDFVATARKLLSSKEEMKYSIELLSKNPNIKIANNISKQIKEITNDLIKQKKYKNLEDIAKNIGKSRDTIYAIRNEKFYHGISIKNFVKLGLESGRTYKELSKSITRVFITHGKEINIPKTTNNKKLAYITGLLIGDGSIYSQDNSKQIRLYNISKEILETYDKYIEELFNIKTEKYVQKGVGVRRISSEIVFILLKEFGLNEKKINNKISHFASSTKMLKYVLQGIFDTDGYVSKNNSSHIGISTISKELAQTTQLSLLKFGVISKIRERKLAGRISRGKNIVVTSKHNQFVLEIRGENKNNFRKQINFNVKEKKESLKKIIIEKNNPNLDIIPELGELLNNKKIKWEYKSGKLCPSRKKLLELSKKTNDLYLSKIAQSDLIWEKIVSKEEFIPEYEYVYDFTIEETHNFVANGFITHNTASAVKDEFGEGGWTLKAGALVLSSGGICMADELDKMDPNDRSALHEAMEQGMISVAKAGIVSRFKADTTMLAAANPKFSRFDKFQPFLEQINLPASLISRFDLFFMIRDVLDKTQDINIATHILNTHQSGEKIRQSKQTGKPLTKEEKENIDKITKPPVDSDLLKKYISLARQKCFPVLSGESMQKIIDFYVGLRDQGRNEGNYAATARQLEGLVRLSEASAKIRLKDVVELEDAERAIRLVRRSLEETVTDPETGKIDIDIVTSGLTHSKQNAISVTLKIIKDAMAEGIDMVPIEQVITEGMEKGLDESKINSALEDLEKKGEIYKPRHHFVKPTKKH
ncbi:MAG: LAGLIDADG family homing endonuclease [Candidatus ainarchaeum sp.]|nr:LAGLIDADG family homing endonuclease [Candidatus ainarchaeum sp.]